eukprot:4773167-Amphidinium_carterae.1
MPRLGKDPKYNHDTVPYKYIMPQSEAEFLAEGRPGVFWRIVEGMVANPDKDQVTPDQGRAGRAAPPVRVVSTLTHLMKQAPCTVLATYADGTCDVELSANFVQDWQHQGREFSLPGTVVWKSFKVTDDDKKWVDQQPPGLGAVEERVKVVVKEVPMSALRSVQVASFNIYDATFSTTDDSIAKPPSLQ